MNFIFLDLTQLIILFGIIYPFILDHIFSKEVSYIKIKYILPLSFLWIVDYITYINISSNINSNDYVNMSMFGLVANYIVNNSIILLFIIGIIILKFFILKLLGKNYKYILLTSLWTVCILFIICLGIYFHIKLNYSYYF